MTRTRTGVVTASFFLLAAAVALTLVLLAGKSSGPGLGIIPKAGEADAAGENSAAEVVREGPTSFEQWRAQSRTYPAKAVPAKVVARARATFNRIAARDARRLAHSRRLLVDGTKWKLYGPTENATEPGVISFSGATNNTASRVTALVADPDCNANHCRLWAGVSGGGVWRTDNATVKNPEWKQISPEELDQNSVGTLTLLPGKGNGKDTLYLGTGEANRCSSGCESGVGIYRSKDGGEHWQKLADRCVDTLAYPCVTPGTDAFLGRGINSIVIDPRNANHVLVGSARGVRGLSHVIGAGGTSRFEPGANDPGLYESMDGGASFKMVWDGTKPDPGPISYGITDLGLDPVNPDVVWVAGFDAGVWRRDAGAASTSFQQVFKPQFNNGGNTGAGIDRSMFALTVKDGHTRVYLTDGTAAGGGPTDPFAANFWRTDNGSLPAANAARVAAGRAAGGDRVHLARPGDAHLPRVVHHGLAVPHLTRQLEPVLHDDRLLLGAVLVRRGDLHAGRHARHGLRDRRQPVRRAAVRHEGRRLRKRRLERPRGALLEHRGRS